MMEAMESTTFEIVELTLTNSCGVPYEWDGTTAEGEPVYVRWRSGYLGVSVGGNYGLDGQRVLEMTVDVLDHDSPSVEAILELVDATDYIHIGEPDEVPEATLRERHEKFDQEHAVGATPDNG